MTNYYVTVEKDGTLHYVSLEYSQQSNEESWKNLVYDMLQERLAEIYKDESLMHERLTWALNKLTPREEKVVELFYGLKNEEPLSVKQIAVEFGVSENRCRQILEKALRKLRSGSRVAAVCYSNQPQPFSCTPSDLAVYKALRKVLTDEIKTIVEGNEIRGTYLPTILKKHNMSIRYVPTGRIVYDVTLENLDLSYFTYVRLKHEGINTARQLKAMDQIKLGNCIGTERAEEVKSKVEDFFGSDGFTTLEYDDGQGRIIDYKYLSENADQVTASIFYTLRAARKSHCLLDVKLFSPGLTTFLLLQGCFYKEDIDADYETLYNRLTMCDMDDYGKELCVYRKRTASEPVLFLKISGETYTALRDGKFVNFSQIEQYKSINAEAGSIGWLAHKAWYYLDPKAAKNDDEEIDF